MSDDLLCVFCNQPAGVDSIFDSNDEVACKTCGEAELKAQRREKRALNALRKTYSVIVRDTDASGAIRLGQHNKTMRELRQLGFYTLDKTSIVGFGLEYHPTWRITPAGRDALMGEDHA